MALILNIKMCLVNPKIKMCVCVSASNLVCFRFLGSGERQLEDERDDLPRINRLGELSMTCIDDVVAICIVWISELVYGYV